MGMDYSRLQGRIAEKMGTQARFAREMALSERTISLKLNGKRPFKQDEILRAARVLDIRREEISPYFFTQDVQNR